MDFKHRNQVKQVRVRVKPYKKWSATEEILLIDFLFNNRANIEKPSAQVFYRRFCNENNLLIDWKTVRTKVTNMRNSFFSAKAFEIETKDHMRKEQVEEKILKKCNYYRELESVFDQPILQYPRGDKEFEYDGSNLHSPIIIDSDDTTQDHMKASFRSSVNKSDPEYMEIQSDFYDSKQLKLHEDLSIKCGELGVNEKELSFDNKLKVMELILKEKKLILKERQLNRKEKIQIHEMNSQEKLKILELEMKERLASEELKLKYK